MGEAVIKKAFAQPFRYTQDQLELNPVLYKKERRVSAQLLGQRHVFCYKVLPLERLTKASKRTGDPRQKRLVDEQVAKRVPIDSISYGFMNLPLADH